MRLYRFADPNRDRFRALGALVQTLLEQGKQLTEAGGLGGGACCCGCDRFSS